MQIALVPTMGALHAGHLSLVKLAGQLADKTIVSIFVNPTQFAPTEDLATYPRQEEEDLQKLTETGCDLIFLPIADEVYPNNFSTSVSVATLSDSLCGLSRPHFFGGVATIVCKLLNQSCPDIAIFGEKDYQQLLIIRRMVRDLDIPTQIVGGPIIRENDGLAMSSRNEYLSKPERQLAGKLNVELRELIRKVYLDTDASVVLREAKEALIRNGFDRVDYLEIRSGIDLAPYGPGKLTQEQLETARVFAAAVINKTRLIDNMQIGSSNP